jgi:hypothetical protein
MRLPLLRELDLRGNSLTGLQLGAFKGVPNLVRLDLGENRFLSSNYFY